VFLHFQDDRQLGKILFLKNEWALDAAYAIVDDQIIKSQNGHFTRNDAIRVWGKDYHLVYDDLLALMKRFYLVYEINNSACYIAPQMLPDDKPDYTWDESENLQLRYEYDDFMPQGILWQFIAIMHQQIKSNQLVWRSGVVLSEGIEEAEVTEVYGKHKINIRIRGKNKSEMRTIIA
jgi:internalin A